MTETAHLTCIVCPLGCRLAVTRPAGAGEYEVTGNRCRRGADYARSEMTDPRRVLTSTVTLTGAAVRRLPVKTVAPIPKPLLLVAAQELRKVTAAAPVRAGEVIVPDLAGTGVAVVATREAEPAGDGRW